jgi:hypothetical protein
MDDIVVLTVVLTTTRWVLRRAVRLVHTTLRDLGLEVQPTKTFIEPIEKGFDFLLDAKIRNTETMCGKT